MFSSNRFNKLFPVSAEINSVTVKRSAFNFQIQWLLAKENVFKMSKTYDCRDRPKDILVVPKNFSLVTAEIWIKNKNCLMY